MMETRSLFLLGAAAFALAACVQTQYRGLDQKPEEANLVGRDVYFNVSPSLYTSGVACVTVMPADGAGNADLAAAVERSLARQLTARINRVIGPIERNAILRRHVLDIGHDFDRDHYVAATGCRHFATPTVEGVEDSFIGIFSRTSLTLGVSLRGHADGEILWQASHNAGRSAGGLPLSPLSIGTAVASALHAKSDPDRMPSLIDDIYRRIVVTLPDLRKF